MYDRATRAKVHGNELLLTGPKNFEYKLERTPCFVMLESTELVVRSMAEWPFEHEGNGEPTFKTTISATCRPHQHRLFAFKGEDFLGRVAVANFWCGTGGKNHIRASIFEPEDGSGVDQLTLGLTCVLTEPSFKEVFHPIWLRQSKSVLDTSFHIDGYQFGPEGAFEEPGDTSNFVFDVRAMSARFQSLSLRTNLNSVPPPLSK